MIDNIFDKKIADSLKRVKVEYDSKSWERLENKLNKEENENVIFDNIISGKLKAFSVFPSKGSFDSFERKYLDGRGHYNRYYYYISGIAAAVLLIVFALFNFNTSNGKISDDAIAIQNKNKIKKEFINTSTKGNISNNILSKDLSVNSNQNVAVDYSSVVDSRIPHRIVKRGKYRADIIPIENDLNGVSVGSHNYGLSNVLNRFSSPYSLYGNRVYNNNSVNDIEVNSYFNRKPIEGMIFGQISFSILIEEGRDIENLDENRIKVNDIVDDKSGNSVIVVNDEMEEENKNRDIANKGLPLFIKDDTRISNGLVVSANVSPNIDFINTPHDLDFNTPSYNKVAMGYGAGVSVSYKKGKHEVGTGIDYSVVSYKPRKNTAKSNTTSYFLNNIEYNNIKVPINYKYHVIENKDWDVYSVAGVSANVIIDSDYEFAVIDGGDYSLKNVAGELKDDLNFSKSIYAKKEYPTKNTYLAINAGVGIKKKMSNNISVFVEPQYNYNFGHFGANDDALSSVNIKFGITKTIDL